MLVHTPWRYRPQRLEVVLLGVELADQRIALCTGDDLSLKVVQDQLTRIAGRGRRLVPTRSLGRFSIDQPARVGRVGQEVVEALHRDAVVTPAPAAADRPREDEREEGVERLAAVGALDDVLVRVSTDSSANFTAHLRPSRCVSTTALEL